MIGFVAGLAVAAALSLAATAAFDLGPASAFLVGCTLGVVCTLIGGELDA